MCQGDVIPDQISVRQGKCGLCPLHTASDPPLPGLLVPGASLGKPNLRSLWFPLGPHAVWPLTRYEPPNLQMQIQGRNKPWAALVILHNTRTREALKRLQRWASKVILLLH